MSSDDSQSRVMQHRSGRQSSEGTASEHNTSDGAQTAMTSIMDTDEEALEAEGVIEAEGPIAADSVEVDEDAADVQSLYPASYYPAASTAHRTEMPFLPSDHQMNTQEDA